MRIQLDNGFIEWEQGTGGNIEITHIRVYEKRKGTGKQLMRELLKKAEAFHSFYAFAFSEREDAISFYKAVGFKEILCGQSVYKSGRTSLMWATYEDIRKAVGVLP